MTSLWDRVRARSLFPLLTVVPTVVAMKLIRDGFDVDLVVFATVGVGLFAQLVLELVIPYRRAWLERRKVLPDFGYLLLAALTQAALSALFVTLSVVAAVTLLPSWSSIFGDGLWPQSWPIIAQLLLAIAVGDAGHYLAHRALHEVPWLWRFHRLHHTPDHLHALNFFRMHPVEISLKTLCNLIPLFVLGAGPEVIALWSVISAVAAGSVNHANIEMNTEGFDLFLSTPALHRYHHSSTLREANTNYGNITVLYDRLFGTYLNPGRRPVSRVGLIRQKHEVR